MSDRWSSRQVSHMAIMVAAMMAWGYALALVPNVELMTLTAFLSGWMLGSFRGGMVGGIGAALYSLFNPWGPPLPPVLLAQTLGLALAGVAGGGLRRAASSFGWLKLILGGDGKPSLGAVLLLEVVGVALTLAFDVATNLAHALALGMMHQWRTVLLAGLSFGILHVVSNGILFALLGPLSIHTLGRRLGGVGLIASSAEAREGPGR